MINVWQAFLAGSFFGLVNGFLCRLLLKRYLEKSSKIFMTVFFVCFFYKLIFLLLSFLILKSEKSIILIIYFFSLIFIQVLFELKPLKKSGK